MAHTSFPTAATPDLEWNPEETEPAPENTQQHSHDPRDKVQSTELTWNRNQKNFVVEFKIADHLSTAMTHTDHELNLHFIHLRTWLFSSWATGDPYRPRIKFTFYSSTNLAFLVLSDWRLFDQRDSSYKSLYSTLVVPCQAQRTKNYRVAIINWMWNSRTFPGPFPRFFLPCFHGSRASRLGHKRKEKTRSITCRTDLALG